MLKRPQRHLIFHSSQDFFCFRNGKGAGPKASGEGRRSEAGRDHEVARRGREEKAKKIQEELNDVMKSLLK